MADIVFRDVEVTDAGGSRRRDVVIAGNRIVAVGGSLDMAGARVVDGRGRALLPGLHDHHVHLYATVAHSLSVQCGPPRVHTPEELADALAAAPGDGWIRGVGYVETVAGLLDSPTLDRLCAARPVRMAHRSGAMWTLNTVAAKLVGLDDAEHPGVERDDAGRATGRVWRADDWLRERLPPAGRPELTGLGRSLAALGITGVTDATPDLTAETVDALAQAHRSRELPQRLRLLGVPIELDPALPIGVSAGAYKIVLADSGLLEYDDLLDTIRRAHAVGRAVAVHCVSRTAMVLLTAALREAGVLPGDRIEHGAVIPAELVGDLAELGVRVITQPGFIADRGDDYLRRVDAEDLGHLYRCRSLLDAGVSVGLSSDAPYGPLSPWEVIAAAASRTAHSGAVVGAGEKITVDAALAAYCAPLDDPGGPPRVVAAGRPADVVLLDRPMGGVIDDPASTEVTCTVIDGDVVVDT